MQTHSLARIFRVSHTHRVKTLGSDQSKDFYPFQIHHNRHLKEQIYEKSTKVLLVVPCIYVTKTTCTTYEHLITLSLCKTSTQEFSIDRICANASNKHHSGKLSIARGLHFCLSFHPYFVYASRQVSDETAQTALTRQSHRCSQIPIEPKSSTLAHIMRVR